MDVKEIRLTSGLNQTDFWAQYGVKQGIGSGYELGKHKIPKPVKLLIAIHREISIDIHRFHTLANRIK